MNAQGSTHDHGVQAGTAEAIGNLLRGREECLEVGLLLEGSIGLGRAIVEALERPC